MDIDMEGRVERYRERNGIRSWSEAAQELIIEGLKAVGYEQCTRGLNDRSIEELEAFVKGLDTDDVRKGYLLIVLGLAKRNRRI